MGTSGAVIELNQNDGLALIQNIINDPELRDIVPRTDAPKLKQLLEKHWTNLVVQHPPRPPPQPAPEQPQPASAQPQLIPPQPAPAQVIPPAQPAPAQPQLIPPQPAPAQPAPAQPQLIPPQPAPAQPAPAQPQLIPPQPAPAQPQFAALGEPVPVLGGVRRQGIERDNYFRFLEILRQVKPQVPIVRDTMQSFPHKTHELNQFFNHLEAMYDTFEHDGKIPFKFNVSFAYILKNQAPNAHEEYKHFYARTNNTIFVLPYTINDRNDLDRVFRHMTTARNPDDLKNAVVDYYTNLRPNSQWQFHLLLGYTFWGYHSPAPPPAPAEGVAIGSIFKQLNKAIVACQGVKCNAHFKDTLCVFRCMLMAIHNDKNLDARKIQKEVLRSATHFDQWCKERGLELVRDKGVTLKDLRYVEECFDVVFFIWSMRHDGTIDEIRIPNYTSEKLRVNVDLQIFSDAYGHMSWIFDPERYFKVYKCQNEWCSASFPTRPARDHHQFDCANRSKVLSIKGSRTVTVTLAHGFYKRPKLINRPFDPNYIVLCEKLDGIYHYRLANHESKVLQSPDIVSVLEFLYSVDSPFVPVLGWTHDLLDISHLGLLLEHGSKLRNFHPNFIRRSTDDPLIMFTDGKVKILNLFNFIAATHFPTRSTFQELEQDTNKVLNLYQKDLGLNLVAGVSVGSLVLEILFQDAHEENFYLPDSTDVYDFILKSIVGGPVIVFNHYHERHKTCIRNNPNYMCHDIVSLDANSLYLWCLMQHMPCGTPQFIEYSTPPTAEVLYEGIKTKQLFGFVECDVEVPSGLIDHFSELCPIFLNAPDPRTPGFKKLYGTLSAKRIVIFSELLSWYISHGLKVDNIRRAMWYSSKKPFESFGNLIWTTRKRYSSQGESVLADTVKLFGNSAYGKLISSQTKLANLSIQKEYGGLADEINNDSFMYAEPIVDSDYFIVATQDDHFKAKTPIQIAAAVYGYAKLRMLSFYYDFVLQSIPKTDFELCFMDTDSFTFAFKQGVIEQLTSDVWMDTSHSLKPGLFKIDKLSTIFFAKNGKEHHMDASKPIDLSQIRNTKRLLCNDLRSTTPLIAIQP